MVAERAPVVGGISSEMAVCCWTRSGCGGVFQMEAISKDVHM